MSIPFDELRGIALAKYRDDDLADMVMSSAKDAGTIERILDGECTLPSKADAIHHRNRTLGLTSATQTETAQQLTIRDLEKRLRIVEESSVVNTPAPA